MQSWASVQRIFQKSAASCGFFCRLFTYLNSILQILLEIHKAILGRNYSPKMPKMADRPIGLTII
jgi:hypothetical protein